MAPPKPDPERVAEAGRLYHHDGLTRDEVAKRLGVEGSTVTRWLAGSARPRGPRKRTEVADAKILDLKNREGLSFAEIARRTGMSKTGARMRYYAITGRERPERRKAAGEGEARNG